MIIVYDPAENNRITNIKFDPVPEGSEEHLAGQGVSFVVYSGELTAEQLITFAFVNADGEVELKKEIAPMEPLHIAADGVDTATIEGLPDPINMMIDGNLVSVTGGVIEFTSEDIGVYVIKTNDLSVISWSVEVHAS